MSSPANGKPQIAEADVLALLHECFAAPIEDLEVVSGGQIAQTYGFSAGGERYILRFTQHMGAELDKELFIQRLLAASPVPTAPILHVGRLGDLHYATSRRIPGAPLTSLPPDAYEEAFPALVQTLDDIHAVDVSAMSGFGIFGDDGVGFFPSWRASLAVIREEEPEWDFYGKWHTLFETTFLERDVWDGIYARMTESLAVCPEERSSSMGTMASATCWQWMRALPPCWIGWTPSMATSSSMWPGSTSGRPNATFAGALRLATLSGASPCPITPSAFCATSATSRSMVYASLPSGSSRSRIAGSAM